jgi:2-keto-4-pentenoate hydratase/2-oxohepta-3-ene-1,7-dioic acid hydratase in catechol pathway
MPAHSYRLATYADSHGRPRAGLVVDDRVIDVCTSLRTTPAKCLARSMTSVMAVLKLWSEIHPHLQEIARNLRDGKVGPTTFALSNTCFLAPIPHPGTIFRADANHSGHVTELSKEVNLSVAPDTYERGSKRWQIIKASAECIHETGSRISLSSYPRCVDWEAEIAVVIGRDCRDVSVDRAFEFVAGLSILNHLVIRDHSRHEGEAADFPSRPDSVSRNLFDGALVFGPWICPFDEIRYPDRLRIRVWINEELVQDTSSPDPILSISEQVSQLSLQQTLRPGDVIAIGTAAASDRSLKPGDRVSIWVEGVGLLLNEFTD